MERKPVRSTDIKSIGYDEETKTLEVEFHSGGLYQYLNVPKGTYSSLMNAASHGTYLHLFIKGKFGHRKLR